MRVRKFNFQVNDYEFVQFVPYLSRLMGKPTICICENKDADQLRGNREADQHLCFRYSDSTLPLLLNSKISSFQPASIAVQAGLCRTRLEATLLVFPRGGSFIVDCVAGQFFSWNDNECRRCPPGQYQKRGGMTWCNWCPVNETSSKDRLSCSELLCFASTLSSSSSSSSSSSLHLPYHCHKSFTRITHSHLLKREDEPKCIGCDTPFTVKHFLLECTDFAAERISCFQANNLKELFKDVPVRKILSFLRQVNLFYKI